MKNLIRIFAAGILAFSLSSCSQDFKVSAPYKPITIVYGMLDMGDTAHYIRIEKAFIDEHISALTLAQNADSSTYANLNVYLRQISANGNVFSTSTLTKVDLNTEGYPKDSGTFFSNVSYAYKTKMVLSPSYTYRLVINNPATGESDSSETAVISNLATDFSAFYPNPVSFPAVASGAQFKINGTAPANTSYLEGIITFKYVDKDETSGAETHRSFSWTFAKDTVANGGAFTLTVDQADFYPAFYQGIGAAPANTDRYVDSINVSIWSATQDFRNYLNYTSATGGITADQIKPNFTNIKGSNVIGIFADRARTEKDDLYISDQSLDSLISKADPSLRILGRYHP